MRQVPLAELIAKASLSEDQFAHAKRVAQEVAKYDVPQHVVHAALLHDVIEDAGLPLDEVPLECQDIVMWLTNNPAITGTRLTRKAAVRERLSYAPWPVKLIKLCDRLDNVRRFAESDPKFLREVYGKESYALATALLTVGEKNDMVEQAARELGAALKENRCE